MTEHVEVTVLTDPIPWGMDLFSEGARRVARFVRDRVRPPRQNYNRTSYRGHPAVTRSLVEGLKKIGASFNYNPIDTRKIAENVIVLSNPRTLRQEIRFKQQGRIKKLFAGPNIMIFSSDFDSLLAATEIDCVITPCDWVIDLYVKDNPTLEGRCISWPAGVDTEYWRPESETLRDRILIFEKQAKGPVGPVGPYADYLRGLGREVDILQYGSFTHVEYLEKLKRSCLMLGFVTDESQGIAWAEAWSVDVPTLIWKNDFQSKGSGGRTYPCSTAPYLSEENGLFFNDFEDFKLQFAYLEANRKQFRPREWVINNMSDDVCASKLIKEINGVCE